MLKPTAALVVGLLVAAFAPAMAAPVTEEEAHAIGVDAYVYFYPMLSMDVTRTQLTNDELGRDRWRSDQPIHQYPRISAGGHEGRSSARISIRCIRAPGWT